MIDFVLGRRGHGKTTLGYYVGSQSPRLLVWDPRGGIRHRNPDERPHSAVATNEAELRRGVNYLITGELTEVIFTPPRPPKKMFERFAAEAARLMLNVPQGTKTCVLFDEVRSLPRGFENDENIDWLLRYTDIDRCRVIFTGHRPKDIPTDVRAIGNRWLLFRFTLPRDFEVLDEHTSPAVAKRVATLNPREFLCWDDSKDGFELFKNPGAWFVVLGAKGVPPSTIDDDDEREDDLGQGESEVDTGLPFGEQ